jgi:S-adenosylmethionine/arginine decarboxylase-like enzyme
MTDKFVPYHQHLLIKCWAKNPPKSEDVLNKWFIDLVHTVGMVVVAGPTSVYVNEPGNEGLTGTVTLATSHGSLHCWDQLSPAMIQFDLYSCKIFTLEQVIKCFEPWGLISYSYVMIDRNDNDFKIVSKGDVVL